MWLTQGHEFFAAFSQSGIQTLNSVFAARPHYFNYATAALGGGTTGVTSLSPLPVPGSASAIDYKLNFPSVPVYTVLPKRGCSPAPANSDTTGTSAPSALCLDPQSICNIRLREHGCVATAEHLNWRESRTLGFRPSATQHDGEHFNHFVGD